MSDSDIHPDVQAALDMARDLRDRIAETREKVDAIRARRPSPGGHVIPEVDALGRLTDLYLTPGTTMSFTSPELITEIMAAITESTADASRQYEVLMENVEAISNVPSSSLPADSPAPFDPDGVEK